MGDRSSAEVDVREIMEQIKARVAARKAEGLYSDEEIEQIEAAELRLEEREGHGENMDRQISWLHANWEATGPVDREAPPPASTAKEAVKKAVLVLLQPLSRMVLAKQNQINARTVQLLTGTLPPMREGFRDLEERVEQLAVNMEKKTEQLSRELEKVSALLEEIEKGGGGRGRP